jgi:cytoskeletal protein CcmA (bactofilin family)
MAQTRATIRGTSEREARIGSGARVRGRVHGEGDLVVEGSVEGELAIRGDLTIAEGGTVTSKAVEAHAVVIAGSFEGDITATGTIRVGTGARVRGNLRGTSVSIDDGAKYSGRLDCEFDLPPELGGTSRSDGRARAPARR